LTSIDGKNFEQAWSGSFEDIPLDPVKWPNEKEAGVSFNFAKTAVFAKPINLRFLKLIVNNGFRKSHWGMDAVEVFGSAPAFIPSPEPCTVLEEIADVKPGPLFIQLVAENDLGRVEGEVIELDRPHLSTPLISDTEIISFDNGKANVRFRVNAMGSWAELSAELTDLNSNTLKSNCVSIGKQEAAREAILSFYGLKHGVTYNGSAIASNKHGMSEQYKLPSL
jgi:hypothetical protein